MPLYLPPGSGGAGDMVLADVQTNTGKKTFNAGTLLDKGEIIFDVRAYGALGTGAGTDHAAIQLAIDAASAGQGGVVFFPPGDFIIGATLTVPSNVSLRGSGRRATRLYKNGGTYAVITIAGSAGSNVEKITISDLSIEGNNQTGVGIDASYAQLLYFNNITVDGLLDSAVSFLAVQDTYFHEFSANTNHHSTKYVIEITDGPAWNSNMIWFTQCRIEDFWAGAVKIYSSNTSNMNGFYFDQCKFETNVVAGDVLVFDQYTEDVQLNHIFIAATAFKAAYSTPCNAINCSAWQSASFTNIFLAGGTGVNRTLLNVVSSSGVVRIDNLYMYFTPTVAIVNFNGSSGATYSIGNVGEATPYFAGTIPANTIMTATTVSSNSATAFTVGPNGATNPALTVDGSTASSATGVKVKSAAAAGGVAVSVTSSGTNENLTVDAKGSGTITLGGTSTGGITLSRDTTLADGKNIVLDTTTGTKVGTATSQKLAFYNSTPIVQPTGNALTALTNLGLVASPTLAVADITASTSTALGVGSIELGHASDTTLSRSSAGVLAVEGVVIPSISSTNTLTNKRMTPRVGTTTSSATPTINTDNYDMYGLTAQAVDITSFTTNLSGTPTDGQKLWIYIVGTAARAITWGTSFEASTVALPTTTVSTNRLDVGFVWNAATSKWRCVASG